MLSTEHFSCSTDGNYNDEFEKIADLSEQQYFELINDSSGCRLVYLMNDAAESFIVFENHSINGKYIPDCEDEINISIEQNDNYYIMIVHQGSDNVFTLSFTGLHSENYLFNYGATGHFWIKGNEKLRIIDYWLGIIREKFNILGESFCNESEKELVSLSYFRPLRYFNSVPEKYMNPNDYISETTEKGVSVFRKYCREAGDTDLFKACENYSDKQLKKIAAMLAGKNGLKTAELIMSDIQSASSGYYDRSHIKKHNELMIKAYTEASAMELEGFLNVRVLREEPFEHTEDTMEFSVFIIAEKNTFTGMKTIVQKISSDTENN